MERKTRNPFLGCGKTGGKDKPCLRGGSQGNCAAVLLIFLATESSALGAGVEEVLPGPVPAAVEEVLDGDTLRVRARIWLGQELSVLVRLAGVDAPEANGTCPRERSLARLARAFVASRLAGGANGTAGVSLREIRYGKYARRVVARVETDAGSDLSAALLAAGLARPYYGGARPDWCG